MRDMLTLFFPYIGQRSVISFCIDISPTMGAKRKIVEEVTLPGNPSTEHRERETTDLQWVNEFVAKKVQSYVG
jgi:hypothetical protein